MAEAPFDVTARVAEVSDAEPFPEANKPEMVKLWLDLGGESPVGSAAWLLTMRQPSSVNRYSASRTSDRSALPDLIRRR